jgi:hypothetical protein
MIILSPRRDKLLDGSSHFSPFFSGWHSPTMAFRQVKGIRNNFDRKENGDRHEVEHIVHSSAGKGVEPIAVAHLSMATIVLSDSRTNGSTHDHVNSLADANGASVK